MKAKKKYLKLYLPLQDFSKFNKLRFIPLIQIILNLDIWTYLSFQTTYTSSVLTKTKHHLFEEKNSFQITITFIIFEKYFLMLLSLIRTWLVFI